VFAATALLPFLAPLPPTMLQCHIAKVTQRCFIEQRSERKGPGLPMYLIHVSQVAVPPLWWCSPVVRDGSIYITNAAYQTAVAVPLAAVSWHGPVVRDGLQSAAPTHPRPPTAQRVRKTQAPGYQIIRLHCTNVVQRRNVRRYGTAQCCARNEYWSMWCIMHDVEPPRCHT
jgi:hypothetical protein